MSGAKAPPRQFVPASRLPSKAWKQNTWEEMARENPMFAVMSAEELAEAPPDGFSDDLLEPFFAKGRRLYRKRLRGLVSLSPDPQGERLVVEYGCGMGRILRAAIEDGERCAGVDISPTMLGHCRRLVPQVEGPYVLDEAGRCALPDASASVVFSFAVVQHISTLSNYLAAFAEMCRILKPGGLMAVHLNCHDFEDGDFARPGRTENLEDHSLHWRPGEAEPYMRHEQSHWSGVYIGHDRLTAFLRSQGVKIRTWSFHNPEKPAAVWIGAEKFNRP